VGEKLRDGYGRFGFWKMNSGMRGTTHTRYARDVGAELGGGGAPRAGERLRTRRARWLGQVLARGCWAGARALARWAGARGLLARARGEGGAAR
jgi:hypothetical protein